MAEMLDALDREWAELATSPRARRALMRWSNSHRHLAGHRDLNDVLEARRDPTRSDDILRSLVELASTDDIAARTTLQAVVPGLVSFAHARAAEGDDAIEELVPLTWIRIRTYPTHRRGSVAANIVLDVRKQYWAQRDLAGRGYSVELAGDDARFDRFDHRPSVEDQVLGRLFIEQLGDLRRGGVSEIDTLARTRLCGERIEDLAAEQGIHPRLLCRRRWNLEVRLRAMTLAA